ncbi:hypothetical protein E4U42_001887 [Claviceps africana]|uniref:Uncharacterized protein n=1 Tax=Claviceps africana TaxID=83212 RepID=A0A8K0J8Q8_9HYPO|nr:hypothetical protein E4U42_001887 [Claviceps africana]
MRLPQTYFLLYIAAASAGVIPPEVMDAWLPGRGTLTKRAPVEAPVAGPNDKDDPYGGIEWPGHKPDDFLTADASNGVHERQEDGGILSPNYIPVRRDDGDDPSNNVQRRQEGGVILDGGVIPDDGHIPSNNVQRRQEGNGDLDDIRRRQGYGDSPSSNDVHVRQYGGILDHGHIIEDGHDVRRRQDDYSDISSNDVQVRQEGNGDLDDIRRRQGYGDSPSSNDVHVRQDGGILDHGHIIEDGHDVQVRQEGNGDLDDIRRRQGYGDSPSSNDVHVRQDGGIVSPDYIPVRRDDGDYPQHIPVLPVV